MNSDGRLDELSRTLGALRSALPVGENDLLRKEPSSFCLALVTRGLNGALFVSNFGNISFWRDDFLPPQSPLKAK